MRVLVTGGAGFVGSHIVDGLLQDGHEVVVIDDLSAGVEWAPRSNVRFHRVDIRSPELQAVIQRERPEVVSHQAALASLRDSVERPAVFAEVNVVGSVNVLEACRRNGVRKVVYASSGGAVYGNADRLPVPEDAPVRPLDPYGASKHHVEHYLDIFSNLYGLEYTVLRYGNVYGPRQSPYGEAGVVAIFAHRMMRGEPVTINGNGEQQRDFVAVTDVAAANRAALVRGLNDTFNIASGQGTSINEIFKSLREITGYGRPPLFGPGKAGEVGRNVLAIDKARAGLGWQPQKPLREGLRDTVDYFRTH